MKVFGTKRLAFLPSALIALVIDQLGKFYTTTTLDIGDRSSLVGDVLALTHVPSMGGAFGFFRDWLPDAQLIGFSALAICTTMAIFGYYPGPGPRGAEYGGCAGCDARWNREPYDRPAAIRFGRRLLALRIGHVEHAAGFQSRRRRDCAGGRHPQS